MTEIKLRTFESQITYFNGMYKLPVAPYPTAFNVLQHEAARTPETEKLSDKGYVIGRLMGFKKTILDEVNEVDLIIHQLQTGFVIDKDGNVTEEAYTELLFLVDLADWLGDLQVYEASEMVKFGLPVNDILKIIMSSNFSKLQADGSALYDANGKVQKGPGYWKPESFIKALLEERISEAAPWKKTEPNSITWRD